jgi:small subunit ribosomal protein S17
MADEVENNEIEETAASDVAAAAGASADEEPTAVTAADESLAQAAGEFEAIAEAQAAAAEAAAEAQEAADADAEAQDAADADAAPETKAAEPKAPAEPEVQLSPKERKAAGKARKAAKVAPRGETSPEERQTERDAARDKKAAERRAGRASSRAKWKAGAHERTATPPRSHETGTQKTRQGVVVSDRADKTITVRIDVARRHRKYQKIVRTSNTLHAHDERNDAHIGDTVIVREARPLSRTKRWRLVQVVERAK